MTTLNQYAGTEWAAPRKETWYEHLLPQRVTDTINQSPLVGALSKYMNSPPPDLTLPSERDKQVPMPRSPSWFDDRPVATEALDKFGLLANFFGPGAKLPPPAPKPQGIRAYHGSPHDFDKFDINKIGTGEGAQAYGRGLYFAENEGVARSYRDALGVKAPAWGLAKNGQYFPADGASYWGVQRLNEKLAGRVPFGSSATVGHNEIMRALAAVKADAANIKGPNGDRLRQELASVDAVIAGNPDLTFMRNPPTGRMYEVKINADPEQFLDWDKPLSQQPEKVRKTLEQHGVTVGAGNTGDAINKAHDWSAAINGWNRDAARTLLADDLKNAGVPGIKYLDQGSRAAGQGSRNYVVFDDALITILRKYGLLPPVAAGAAMAQGQEPPL